MNVLEMLMSAQGGGAVQQMSNQFGLSEGQTQNVVQALLPTLMGAMRQNAQEESIESGGLMELLGSGARQQYVEDPSALASPEAVDQGNDILGMLLGDRQVSRQLASQASAQTGVGSDIIKQMLPLVANLLIGGMSRQAAPRSNDPMSALAGMLGGGQQPQQAQGGGLFDMLTPFLDQNRDGSAMDDVLRMAAGFLRK